MEPPRKDLLEERGGRIDPIQSPEPPLDDDERVDEAIAESFPASDPPSWTSGIDRDGGSRKVSKSQSLKGESADVTLLAYDEERFEVNAELKAVLLESIAQCERGETISAVDLIREMRSRE